jgi:hypothetical protein
MREIGSVPPQMDVREAVFIAASIARFTTGRALFRSDGGFPCLVNGSIDLRPLVLAGRRQRNAARPGEN